MKITTAFQISALLRVFEGVEARFDEVKGNLPVFFLWLDIIWVSAVFDEEMFSEL
ncbi:hypothetical protein [Glaciecola petra]|uniref:Uncharacterized protein n=1 Tax=Glaciecola petra TaxID=3075602 RepID=A0ABU2ZNA5_9ALTE|nr:hypothetical protein [Aestuariibacter sp. P117]MDT0593741.1 hypothetical protein [Aestuariibacter sp. P117]